MSLGSDALVVPVFDNLDDAREGDSSSEEEVDADGPNETLGSDVFLNHLDDAPECADSVSFSSVPGGGPAVSSGCVAAEKLHRVRCADMEGCVSAAAVVEEDASAARSRL